MRYNIEFQIAGIAIVVLLIITFFSKRRWQSVPNSIFRILMLDTFVELAFDIISVITITERGTISPVLNDFFSKGYIVAMHSWIVLVMCYIVASILESRWAEEGQSVSGNTKRLLRHYLLLFVPEAAALFVVAFTPLLYAGEGRQVYSYGPPSTCTYVYSIYCVVLALVYFFVNYRHIPLKKKVTLMSFTLMEGAVALLQMAFPQLLLLGIGTALCVFIMYLNMENPDLDMIQNLRVANEKSEQLLRNILPQKIADSLKDDMTETGALSEKVLEEFSDVTVAFMDIVGFTEMSSRIGHIKIVDILNDFFTQVDELLDSYRIEKIKTIGDAYMVAAGVPERYEGHREEMLDFVFAVQDLIGKFNEMHPEFPALSLRIGVSSGPVVAGVIGEKKYIYDLWGATVNLASRMESYGEPGRVQVSTAVYAKLLQSKSKSRFLFEKREPVEIKGCGLCTNYFVTRAQVVQ